MEAWTLETEIGNRGNIVKYEKKINLTDIKIQDVGNSCIMLTSKFSRSLKAKHGVVIHLQDPMVLSKAAAYAEVSSSVELKTIYKLLEDEVRLYLQKLNPEIPVEFILSPGPISNGRKYRSESSHRPF